MRVAPIFDHSWGDIIVIAGAMSDRNGSETISMPYKPEWEPYARAWRKRVVDHDGDATSEGGIKRDQFWKIGCIIEEQVPVWTVDMPDQWNTHEALLTFHLPINDFSSTGIIDGPRP